MVPPPVIFPYFPVPPITSQLRPAASFLYHSVHMSHSTSMVSQNPLSNVTAPSAPMTLEPRQSWVARLNGMAESSARTTPLL